MAETAASERVQGSRLDVHARRTSPTTKTIVGRPGAVIRRLAREAELRLRRERGAPLRDWLGSIATVLEFGCVVLGFFVLLFAILAAVVVATVERAMPLGYAIDGASTWWFATLAPASAIVTLAALAFVARELVDRVCAPLRGSPRLRCRAHGLTATRPSRIAFHALVTLATHLDPRRRVRFERTDPAGWKLRGWRRGQRVVIEGETRRDVTTLTIRIGDETVNGGRIRSVRALRRRIADAFQTGRSCSEGDGGRCRVGVRAVGEASSEIGAASTDELRRTSAHTPTDTALATQVSLPLVQQARTHVAAIPMPPGLWPTLEALLLFVGPPALCIGAYVAIGESLALLPGVSLGLLPVVLLLAALLAAPGWTMWRATRETVLWLRAPVAPRLTIRGPDAELEGLGARVRLDRPFAVTVTHHAESRDVGRRWLGVDVRSLDGDPDGRIVLRTPVEGQLPDVVEPWHDDTSPIVDGRDFAHVLWPWLCAHAEVQGVRPGSLAAMSRPQ